VRFEAAGIAFEHFGEQVADPTVAFSFGPAGALEQLADGVVLIGGHGVFRRHRA
jgi:hypothetical protein